MWDSIRDIFVAALEVDPADRDVLLKKACHSDEVLFERVATLLAAHDEIESQETDLLLGREALDLTLASTLLEGMDEAYVPGGQIGRYTVIRPVAHGGMGEVVLARDPRLDREVALKLLPRWRSADPDARQRLEEEARSASALNHPGIATVYEIGETPDGALFVAMAWYEGGTLRDRLRSGPLPEREARRIAVEVATGLQAAHAAGIFHRDIKPENLALAADGRTVILDFGIASTVGSEQPSRPSAPGTAAYMSPEQVGGEQAGAADDVWALGVVLYEMLTGRRPFEVAETGTGIRRPVHATVVPPHELVPALPNQLSEVVCRCLSLDPHRRMASADDLLHSLRSLDQPPPLPLPVALRRAAPASAVYMGLAIGVFLLASAGAPHFLLPEWAPGAMALLLLAGLPIVTATSFVSARFHGAARVLTWRRAIGGGVLASGALATFITVMMITGMPRITDARGSAPGLDERPRIVLADIEASEDLQELALAAGEALSVDLGQSPFVTVLSRAQVAQAMRQAGLPPDSPVDFQTAAIVAARLGAGAVLSGSLYEAGDQIVLTGRALDPDTGEEFFSVRAASSRARTLGAVQRLSRELRRRLGEERSQIRQSLPLPAVTTPSLEALQLYAQAERAHIMMDAARAEQLAIEATIIDPGFAMAHRLAAVAGYSQLSYDKLTRHITAAYEFRDRLSERERRHVEAVYAVYVTFDPRQGLAAYERLLERFPDDARGWANLAAVLHNHIGDHEGALAAFRRAIEAFPQLHTAVGNAAYEAAILERWDEAAEFAARATAAGITGFDLRIQLGHDFATGDLESAHTICDSLLTGRHGRDWHIDDREVCGSIDAASGRYAVAEERLRSVQQAYLQSKRPRNVVHAAHGLAEVWRGRGDLRRAGDELLAVLNLLPEDDFQHPDRFIARTAMRVHSHLLGRPDVAARIARAYPPHPQPELWFARFGEGLVTAAALIDQGDGEAALQALDAGSDEGIVPVGWRIFDALLRGMAHELAGRPNEAASHYARAARPGYGVPPYLTKDRLFLPFALEGLARTATDQRAAEATRRLEALRAFAEA